MKTTKRINLIPAAVCLMLMFSCLLVFSAEIDRKTFSVSLPDKWSEDKKDDMYSPDSFIFFDGPESCLFTLIIGKKSAGAATDELLNKTMDGLKKKITDEKITEIRKWAIFEGRGFRIDGKINGIYRSSFTVFAFEKGDSVCLIEETATVEDGKTYASDFEKIRKTLKIK